MTEAPDKRERMNDSQPTLTETVFCVLDSLKSRGERSASGIELPGLRQAPFARPLNAKFISKDIPRTASTDHLFPASVDDFWP